MVNYLKIFAADQTAVQYGDSILRYMQQSSMTWQQYVDDVVTKPCKIVDVHDESTLSDAFIEDVDS